MFIVCFWIENWLQQSIQTISIYKPTHALQERFWSLYSDDEKYHIPLWKMDRAPYF